MAIRSVAVVAAAIALCRPGMPEARRELYARVLAEEGREQGIDPLMMVALATRRRHYSTASTTCGSRPERRAHGGENVERSLGGSW